jgi:hypothetical protein
MTPWRPQCSSCAKLARQDGSVRAGGTSSCASPRNSPSSAGAENGVVVMLLLLLLLLPPIILTYPPRSKLALSLTSPWMAVLSS